MYYFVPAWYPKDRPWYDNSEVWYRSGSHDFDDSISQLRMFQESGKNNQLIILNYMPNLRHFTHRYDLYEVPIWAVFDEIQNCHQIEPRLWDFKSLDWPEGAEFIYSPFLILVRLHGQTLAKIEFGEEGHILFIDYYQCQDKAVRYVFDDRGFLSSCLYSQNGKPMYQDYLNGYGEWQIREYLTDENHQVLVNPTQSERFKKTVYESIEELVAEKMSVYFVDRNEPSDVLIVADHPIHRRIIESIKGQKKLILSYYHQRLDKENSLLPNDLLNQANLVVTDTLDLANELLLLGNKNVQHISLYDTRLRLGKSQRLNELIIHFVLDGISHDKLNNYLSEIFRLMEDYERVHLSLVTNTTDVQKGQEWQEFIEQLLVEQEREDFFLANDREVSYEIDEDNQPVSRITFKILYAEKERLQALDKARIIVDLGTPPHLHTQISAISAGLPQINCIPTEFVEQGRTGIIIGPDTSLAQALGYYLDGLKHWNESLVATVQKITDYTSGKLVQKIINGIK